MTCPKCGRRGRKAFKGYCTRVHQQLSAPPRYIRRECSSCGSIVVRPPSRISKGGRVYCKRCSKNSGENHPRWKEGQYLNAAGYRMVLQKNEYYLEHRLTWEEANNACLLPSAKGIVIIHHINMVKTDNRPENLALMSNEEHGRIHRLMDAQKYLEAKDILVRWLEQQAFFIQHPEHLQNIKDTSLENILTQS